jgi:hypothetical protein
MGYFADGKIKYLNTLQDTIATYTTGDVIRIAIATTLAHRKIWFAVNDDLWDNAATELPEKFAGGYDISSTQMTAPFYPFFNFSVTGEGASVRLNPSQWTFPAPQNFGAINYAH